MLPSFIGFGLFTKEEDITNIFVKYGSIVETKFIKDTYTGQNKGILSKFIHIFIEIAWLNEYMITIALKESVKQYEISSLNR